VTSINHRYISRNIKQKKIPYPAIVNPIYPTFFYNLTCEGLSVICIITKFNQYHENDKLSNNFRERM